MGVEPEGLGLSLEELIKKRGEKAPGGGQRPFRGGRVLGPQDAGVSKPHSPALAKSGGRRNGEGRRPAAIQPQPQPQPQQHRGVSRGKDQRAQQAQQPVQQAARQQASMRQQPSTMVQPRQGQRYAQQRPDFAERLSRPGLGERQTAAPRGVGGQGRRMHNVQFAPPPEPEPEPEPMVEEAAEPLFEVWQAEDGSAVGTLDGTDIAVIAPTGEIYLDSAGYYSLLVLKHMNAILQPMHLRVIATGHVEDGNWQVQDGRSLLRFQDGMRIPPKGLSSSGRAQLVLAAHDKSLVTAANAASTAAAVSAGIAPSPSGQLLSRPGLSAGQNLAPVAAALPAAATTSAAPSPAAIASRLAAVGLTLQDVLALAQSVSAVQPAMGLAALPHSLAGDSNGLVGGMMGSGELGGPSASLGTALPSTQRQPASHTFMSGQAGMSGQMAAASIGAGYRLQPLSAAGGYHDGMVTGQGLGQGQGQGQGKGMGQGQGLGQGQGQGRGLQSDVARRMLAQGRLSQPN
ncbi:hypothetical protein V8C86DRAFT_2470008 [Haematococcus lacustris]